MNGPTIDILDPIVRRKLLQVILMTYMDRDLMHPSDVLILVEKEIGDVWQALREEERKKEHGEKS